MNGAPQPRDILFSRRWHFPLALLLGVAVAMTSVALIRRNGHDWDYKSVFDPRAWRIDPGTHENANPYSALIHWKAIYTGDYQPVFEAAQGYAMDDSFIMYKPEQLRDGRASFVYTPVTALACRPFAAPGVTLQESSDMISYINHGMWLVGGLLLYLIMAHRRPFSPYLLAMFLIVFFGYFPFAQALQLTQASIWIWFFLTIAAFALQRRWLLLAGIALGLGVAIKPHLVAAPVVLFLVPRFPRKPLWWCFGTIAALAVTSFVYAGWDNCLAYVTKTLPKLSAGYAYYPNQTLNGMLLRLFKDQDPEEFNLARAHNWIKWSGTVFFLLIGYVSWRICRRRPADPQPLDDLFCFGVVMATGVLASPVAWLHHFTALAITFVIAVRYLWERPHLRSGAVDFLLFLALLLTGWFFDTRWLKSQPETLLSGWGFYGMILLVLALAIVARRNAGVAPIDWQRLSNRVRALGARIAPLLTARWSAPALVGLACVLDFAIYGYAFGYYNHTLQIPFLKYRLDPTLYPGDPFMKTMEGYFSWFWVVILPLAKMVAMEPLFLGGHFVRLVASYAGVWMLAKKSLPNLRWAPLLATFAYLFTQSEFGDEPMHWFYFTHTTAGTALGIWALVFAVAGSWRVAFALAGILFNVHAMQSAYLLIMFAGVFVPQVRTRWKEGLLGGALWAVCAAPGLWWMLSSDSLGSPENLSRLLRAFYPAHFFAALWEWWHWIGVATVVLLYGFFVSQQKLDERTRTLALMGGAMLAFLAVAGPWSESSNAPGFLLKLHIWRMSTYFVLIVILLGTGWLLTRGRDLIAPPWRPLAVVPMLLAVAALGRSGDLNWYFAFSRLLLLWLGAFAVLALLWRNNSARFVAIGGFLFFTAVAVAVEVKHGARFHQHKDNRYKHWVEAQHWARANTPKDTLFWTPGDVQGWRIDSERRTVMEWIDGAAVLWDRDFAVRWEQWYKDSGGRLAKSHEWFIWDRLGWQALNRTEEQSMELARKYGAEYIVFRLPYPHEIHNGMKHEWRTPALFKNDNFAIYKVAPAGS